MIFVLHVLSKIINKIADVEEALAGILKREKVPLSLGVYEA
jgi:hypothetical protein